MDRNVGKSYKVAALKNFSKFFKAADEFAERRHSELQKLIIASKKKFSDFFVNCFNLANNIGFSGLGNSIAFLSLGNDLGFSDLDKVLFKVSKDQLTKKKF